MPSLLAAKQALQDINLLPVGQMQKFMQTLSACGIDLPAAGANQAAPAAPASPLEMLQQLLNK